MKLFKKEPTFDILGLAPRLRVLSMIAVITSVVAIGLMGLNFGIDFAGGYEIQVKFSKAVSESEIKQALEPMGIADARVQRFGQVSANEYLIMIREQGTVQNAVKQALRSDFEALAGSVDNLTHWALAESGESLNVAFGSSGSEEQVQAILSKHQLEVKSIDKGEREDKPEFMVYLVSLADKIEQSLMTALDIPATENIVKRVEFVGPQVGAELRNQGIMAIIYALGFILLYIAIRFDFSFAPGAIVALVHDVLITVGVFAIFQLEFNLPIIAAILALVGYSLNDTIVVYDRIRENGLRLRGRGLRDLVNTSINQTLSRTLLTSGTTLMVVMALMGFGGGIIKDFSIALCIGVIVGNYSSVYVASPVYIALRERSEGAGAPSNTKKKRAVSSAA